jgi:tyrosyl-tRNA synthetase
MIEDLRWRGLIFDQVEGAEEHLANGPTSVYIGFDPTSDSLHVGSLLPIMVLVHLQRHGHTPIGLVGGATGMIGDPSGKSNERNLLDTETLNRNVEGIRSQLAQFLAFEGVDNPAKLVNNYDWFSSLSFIEVLRGIGKHFPLGAMLGKESVKRRLSTTGISYTEFSYMILQAYDFAHLFKAEGCTVQMGGSDQWGNITAGIELVRRTHDAKAYGVTTPLVTNASGEKFGKSVDGAVWLDPNKTSPFKFYQFWLNQNDEDALRYIKYFTLCTQEEFKDVERRHNEAPHQREAQRFLAADVTRRVHGDGELARVERSTQALFGGKVMSLSAAELEEAFQGSPAADIPHEGSEAPGILDVLVAVGMTKSKGEGRRLIQNRGVSINEIKPDNPKMTLADFDPIEGYLFVIRKGNKGYFLARWGIPS